MNRCEYVANCKQQFLEFISTHKYTMRHVRKYKVYRHNDDELVVPDKILGTVIVFYDDGLRVGFSKVHEGDTYNRHIGIMKAINNAYSEESRNTPRTFQKAITDMVNFAESEKGKLILGEN